LLLFQIVGIHSHEPGETHDHDHASHDDIPDPDYIWKLVVVVAAIWALFIFENGIKLFSSRKHFAHVS